VSYHVSESELQVALGANAETAFKGSEAITNVISMASAMVDAYLLGKGYTPPGTSAGSEGAAVDLVKAATIGHAIYMLYGKQGLAVPEALGIYVDAIRLLQDRDTAIPGMTPSSKTGVGGTQFTSASKTSTTAKPQIFGDLRKQY